MKRVAREQRRQRSAAAVLDTASEAETSVSSRESDPAAERLWVARERNGQPEDEGAAPLVRGAD